MRNNVSEPLDLMGTLQDLIGDYLVGFSKMTPVAAAASILQQNAATSEITRNAANAARGTSMVVSVLSKVSDAAIGTRAAAEAVLTASNSVDTSVGNLRAEIECFLNKVAV
jgi:hypothetical protein